MPIQTPFDRGRLERQPQRLSWGVPWPRASRTSEAKSISWFGRGDSERPVHKGVLWAIRLVTASVIVLISLATAAEPDPAQKISPDDEATTVSVSEQSEEGHVPSEESVATTAPRMNDQNATSTEADGKLEFTDVSDEPHPEPSAQTDLLVYRSQEFDEYHWQPDCPLAGEGETKLINLAEAKRDGLIGCGVCSSRPADKEDTLEERPKEQYLGNRSPVDNSWRRATRKHWREPVENEWRLNSQTHPGWREGRD